MLTGAVDSDIVTGVGVTHDPGSRVIVQDAGNALGGFVGAVADDHHAGVLGEAHTDTAAVVQGNRGAAGGIQQRVQQRPVGNGI